MQRAWLKSVCVMLLASVCLSSSLAEEPSTDESKKDAKSPTMTVFGDLVEIGAELQITSEGGKSLQFNKQPLVSWSNPTRPTAPHGCIFVWNQEGRPQAIGSVFTFVALNHAIIKQQLHSLSAEPLEATFRDRMAWKTTKPGITWQNVAEGMAPHANERLRLTQMRGIARQFRAQLYKPGGARTQLELKPTPLYRYQSKPEKIVDGAIFSFANGTDPDALMLLEAYEDDAANTRWRCAFARFHYWRLVVEDSQGTVVWQVEEEPGLKLMMLGDPRLIHLPYVSYKFGKQPIESD